MNLKLLIFCHLRCHFAVVKSATYSWRVIVECTIFKFVGVLFSQLLPTLKVEIINWWASLIVFTSLRVPVFFNHVALFRVNQIAQHVLILMLRSLILFLISRFQVRELMPIFLGRL
jgi:hypothetical protein